MWSRFKFHSSRSLVNWESRWQSTRLTAVNNTHLTHQTQEGSARSYDKWHGRLDLIYTRRWWRIGAFGVRELCTKVYKILRVCRVTMSWQAFLDGLTIVTKTTTCEVEEGRWRIIRWKSAACKKDIAMIIQGRRKKKQLFRRGLGRIQMVASLIQACHVCSLVANWGEKTLNKRHRRSISVFGDYVGKLSGSYLICSKSSSTSAIMAHLTKPTVYNIEDSNISLLGSDVS